VIIPEYNLIEYYLDFVPLTIRFCPQGVPSGKNREDMLSEVRKEAYAARFSSGKLDTSTAEETNERNDETSSSSSTLIISNETWNDWYPQEWIAWVLYGPLSENPTEYWVTQPPSEGPTEVDTYYTDEKGQRGTKRPPGRNSQREKVVEEKSVSKLTIEANTLRAQQALLNSAEIGIQIRMDDRASLDLIRRFASTDEEKVGLCTHCVTLSLTPSLTHTHTHTHTLSHCVILSLPHSHTHTHTLSHCVILSLPHAHTHSHTHTHSLSLCDSLSPSLTHMHTLSPSFSHYVRQMRIV
jgi:hypothetical protein